MQTAEDENGGEGLRGKGGVGRWGFAKVRAEKKKQRVNTKKAIRSAILVPKECGK